MCIVPGTVAGYHAESSILEKNQLLLTEKSVAVSCLEQADSIIAINKNWYFLIGLKNILTFITNIYN